MITSPLEIHWLQAIEAKDLERQICRFFSAKKKASVNDGLIDVEAPNRLDLLKFQGDDLFMDFFHGIYKFTIFSPRFGRMFA